MPRLRADYPFNTLLRRYCAQMTDWVIFGVVAMPGHFVEKTSRTGLPIACFISFWAFVSMYEVWMHWRYGATLGKMFFYLRVRDVSGACLTLRQAFLRCSVYIGVPLLALPVYIAAVPLVCIRRPPISSFSNLLSLSLQKLPY